MSASIRVSAHRTNGIESYSEVDHVFHVAGVPQASHLRARRLGLVALEARRLGPAIARPRGPFGQEILTNPLEGRLSYPAARAAMPHQTGGGSRSADR